MIISLTTPVIAITCQKVLPSQSSAPVKYGYTTIKQIGRVIKNQITYICDAYDSEAYREGKFKAEVHLLNGERLQTAEDRNAIKALIQVELANEILEPLGMGL